MAGSLADAGVPVILNPLDNLPRRFETLHAALAALTREPAEIFGIAEDHGSLEEGKVADLVLWDGDPLEVTSYPDRDFIAGREIPRESRQTRLRDRYLQGGEWPQAYPDSER